jgi:signal transduction histidine kinase
MSAPINKRILVVDDNAAIHEDVRKVLGVNGAGAEALADARAAFFGDAGPEAPAETYEIDSAYQGQEALEKVREALAEGRPYGVAFVDVRMPPGWDGVETLVRLFEVDPCLQAVICTAFSDYSWDQMLAKLGRSDRLLLLKKPFDTVEVQQLACALTEKWNAAARERKSMDEARCSEKEARAYASSLAAMNRALEAARASAVASAQSKSEFLANMSKEVHESMVASLDAAERLRGGVLDPEQQQKHLDSICDEGRHLLDMLSDVHDLSSIETGRLALNRRDVSPRDVLSLLAERHGPQARSKGVKLGVEVGSAVPETVRTDGDRVSQILDHLVTNAVKFTERGEIRVRADLEAVFGGEPGRLQIVVEDTGVGISPEQRAKLFEAFSPAGNSPQDGRIGAGLGLALSRRLAQVLGGELDVDSELGRGSRFTLSIPCQAQTVPGAPGASTPAPTLRGRILLVEDTPATQRLFGLYLQRAGAEVDACRDGASAMERAMSSHDAGRDYDVILLSMHLPAPDGFAVARHLRSQGYKGPIVGITASREGSERARCLAAGCDEHLEKPIERNRLISVCREWIGKSVPPALPGGSPAPAPARDPS